MRIVFLLLFLFASNAHAQAIYLECELSGKAISFGSSTSTDELLSPRKIAVTVFQNQKDLIILGEGEQAYSFSVSTKNTQNAEEFKVKNHSTSAYYDLSNEKTISGLKTNTSVSLDRVTGAIQVSVMSSFDTRLFSKNLGGLCKKVPAGNKF